MKASLPPFLVLDMRLSGLTHRPPEQPSFNAKSTQGQANATAAAFVATPCVLATAASALSSQGPLSLVCIWQVTQHSY
jgi:hypothetical protein